MCRVKIVLLKYLHFCDVISWKLVNNFSIQICFIYNRNKLFLPTWKSFNEHLGYPSSTWRCNELYNHIRLHMLKLVIFFNYMADFSSHVHGNFVSPHVVNARIETKMLWRRRSPSTVHSDPFPHTIMYSNLHPGCYRSWLFNVISNWTQLTTSPCCCRSTGWRNKSDLLLGSVTVGEDDCSDLILGCLDQLLFNFHRQDGGRLVFVLHLRRVDMNTYSEGEGEREREREGGWRGSDRERYKEKERERGGERWRERDGEVEIEPWHGNFCSVSLVFW